MMKKLTWKKYALYLPLLAGMLNFQAYADQPNIAVNVKDILPADWKAHPPYRLKSKFATSAPTGLSPAQTVKAYGFPVNQRGKGQVIAIVDAMDNPNIEASLNVFSTTYGLPPCTTANGCFQKVYASGVQPPADKGWGVEIALDVEWVHAIAPEAKILLVESVDASSSLFDAINVAIQNGANVVSLSWGGSEFNGESTLDSIFKNSPVPIVAASGDSGHGGLYPAASPYVLSVGGTTLNIDQSGNYLGETAWSGSGGGLSLYEPEPPYQVDFPLPQNPNKNRGIPDVSYNASPASGFSVYDSFGLGGWSVVGGTSAGTPQWASLVALASATAGKNLPLVNTALFSGAKTAYSTLYHDITMGQNGSCGYYCNATTGYDYVTGLGTPQAGNVIAYLGNQGGGCVRAAPSVTITPSSQVTSNLTPVNYSVTIKNNDSTSCSQSIYSLTATTGNCSLKTLLQPSTATLSPGSSANSVLTATPQASIIPGSYTIAVRGGTSSSSGTATATLVYQGCARVSLGLGCSH